MRNSRSISYKIQDRTPTNCSNIGMPVDLVLVEGFKRSGHPKIEVHRAANGKPFLWPDDPDIAGIAADVGPGAGAPSSAGLDDIERIADMMLGAALPIEAVQARLAARGE